MKGISGVVEEPVPFQEGFHQMELDIESGCYPQFFPPQNEELIKKTTGLLGFRLFLVLQTQHALENRSICILW